MKRLGRWLFNFATVLSLILLVATLALWAIAHGSMPGLRCYFGHTLVALYATEGHAGLFWTDAIFCGDPPANSHRWITVPNNWSFWSHQPITTIRSLSAVEKKFLGFGYGDARAAAAGDPLQEVVLRELRAGKIESTTARLTELRAQNLRMPSRIQIPLWSIAAVLLVLPARVAASLLFRRKRFQSGCCTTCGYDLRATPQRCPECGAIPDTAEGIVT